MISWDSFKNEKKICCVSVLFLKNVHALFNCECSKHWTRICSFEGLFFWNKGGVWTFSLTMIPSGLACQTEFQREDKAGWRLPAAVSRKRHWLSHRVWSLHQSSLPEITALWILTFQRSCTSELLFVREAFAFIYIWTAINRDVCRIITSVEPLWLHLQDTGKASSKKLTSTRLETLSPTSVHCLPICVQVSWWQGWRGWKRLAPEFCQEA